MRLILTSVVGLALVGVAVLSASCGGGGGSAAGAGAGGLVVMHAEAPPLATTGEAYSHQFAADFPHNPGFFIVTGGALPTGVSLDAFTGLMTGFPRQVGNFHVQIAARDGVDKSLPEGRDVTYAEDRREFDISVARGLPSILPQVVPAAEFHKGYSYSIDVAGGYPPYTFQLIGGTLPAGLAVLPTGEISGFPDQFQPLPYQFQVRVTDTAGQTDSEFMSVQIFVLPLVIGTSTLPTAVVGNPYDYVFVLASPGGGAPYAWTQMPLQPGDTVVLDAIGLEVSSDGHLRVKTGFPGPTLNGTFVFTVQATDDAGQVVSRQLSLKIVLGPVLTSISPKSSSSPGPFNAFGANFQPGATLTFKPGASQVVITPTFMNSGQLQFASAPPKPGGVGGIVPVRVDNLDGGSFLLNNAYVFPASTISFGTKGLITSVLSSTGLDAADVNGDGRGDVVHCGASGFVNHPYGSTYGGYTSTNGGVILHMNTGGGANPTFGSTTLDPGNFWDVKFVDVNGDGKLDIVALAATFVKTWLNGVSGNPLGTFSTGPQSGYPIAIANPAEMAVGKFDNDSIPDIVLSTGYYQSTNGRVITMKGTGTGAFTPLSTFDGTLPSLAYGVLSVACVDINSDGISDVVASRGYMNSGSIGFWSLSNGASGLLGPWTNLGANGSSYSNTLGVASGNFLGTGAPAVVTVNTSDPQDYNVTLVHMFSGSNLGTVTSMTAPTGLAKCVAPLDGDFDAQTDWAISSQPGRLTVYRGATKAIVASLDTSVGTPSVTSPRTGRIASADLDGDGRNDILVTTSYWATDYQPYFYGATTYNYTLGLASNGGTMGVVFYLNSSN